MRIELSAFIVLLPGLSLAVHLTGYDFIVVGSGAGGGPLAARLALSGHKTLLLEAGDDQGENTNYTVPAFSARASEDGSVAWDFFVRHYADNARQARDQKTSYRTSGGDIYTGLNPPEGAEMLGTLYPRTGTLGGCTTHNALVAIYPHGSDFEYIATLAGDASWSPDNMRKYFMRMDQNRYLLPLLAKGHGFSGWLSTETAPLTIPLEDPQLLSLVLGGASALGNHTKTVINLATLLAGMPIPTQTSETEMAVTSWPRSPPMEYPLDVRLNAHVTKVLFDESGDQPRASGVEFLDSQYLYMASPRYHAGRKGIPGSAAAKREVIVAGGTYNSPQLLKLSGIGPKDELARFGIKVVKDLPGVGTNLQDHYEVAVQGSVSEDFHALKGCTFRDNPADDACLKLWKNPVLGNRGTYASNGLAVSMLFKSSASVTSEYDAFVFGGPVNFRGYFPKYTINTTARHDLFTWVVLKAHPRNTAGSVTLRSADPLDVPNIVYNYFDAGVGDSAADLPAIREAVTLARDAFKRQLVPAKEQLPGPGVKSD